MNDKQRSVLLLERIIPKKIRFDVFLSKTKGYCKVVVDGCGIGNNLAIALESL